MSVKLRFAPSPTGLLHIGNLRTALLNWMYARKHKGEFILRFDDTDHERSKKEYVDSIHRDLEWLGLKIDDVFHQLDRMDDYNNAAERLKESGRLYPCFETPRELEFKRKRLMSQGQPPIYDRAALKLSQDEIDQFLKEGRKPHWRFKLLPEKIEWDDMAHGPMEFHGENLSDPILIRENGMPVYTLPSVVDDLDKGITHIMRGDDHITNTAIQLQLIQALGGDVNSIKFAHFPLLTGEKGEGLSKRLGSLSIQSLREENTEAMAILSYLSKLGSSQDILPCTDFEQLLSDFSLEKYGRSSPKFSVDTLNRLNEKYLHSLNYQQIKMRLDALGLSNVDEDFWEFAKGNIEKLTDLKELLDICFGDIHPIIEEPDYINQALELLPQGPWDMDTWKSWTQALKEETGRKGKNLFMPLRMALTGQKHGPEMKEVLLKIGYDKAKARLQNL